jgi:diguanylate cyclase (GGDEF)-like protein/PAS domain S-box-containing protein
MSTNNHDQPQPRILLADDDVRLLDSLQMLLTVRGYQVDKAIGGAEAKQRLSSEPYDLLLLDLRMPRVSGHEVLRYMRDNEIRPMTIVVSGETSLSDITGALRMGAYDYIRKPYMPEELLATVKNALGKKQLEDSHRLMQWRLDRSEKLHRFIVNNSPDIIFVLDEEGRFSFLNSRIQDLLGYPAQELLGRHLISIVDDDHVDKARRYLDQAWWNQDLLRATDIVLKPRQRSLTRRHFELTLWPVTESDELNGQAQHYRTYGTARDVTERKEAQEFISFQAYHDMLTRLPNRTLFKDRLSVAIGQAERSGLYPAVMFVDLDRFKVINDSLGHSVGDRLLQAVSQRLQGVIRKGDTLSRFGGDEFTLLLPDVQSPEVVSQVAEKILGAIRRPFEVDGRLFHIGASIGIAVYPDGGTTMDALVKNADIAMYRVKGSGKNGYRLFSKEMDAGTAQRLTLEQELREALDRDEFDIHYQPQIDVNTGALLGVEALARWNHPTRGELAPATFIAVAEDSGLILELDPLILQKACRQVKALADPIWPQLRLAVNLSPLLVERDNFVELVLGVLQREGFPPGRLELEITEGLLMSDRADVIDKLRSLHDAGVHIAIDDFGTGYSSLSYLHKFPISTLKIDRSFIADIKAGRTEACIVNAIVAMAEGLQLRVVAEGVENEAQLQYLRALGCPVVQGFLFSRPRPLKEFIALRTLAPACIPASA